MCLQCCAEAVSYGEILPGWTLMRATKTYYEDWKEGEWGLVRINDPDIIWEGGLKKDPTYGMTDAQIDSLSKEESAEYDAFENAVIKFKEQFYLPPENGYDLIMAANKVGFAESGERFVYWFMHRLGCWVETHKPMTAAEEYQDYLTNLYGY